MSALPLFTGALGCLITAAGLARLYLRRTR
jgi:hypothetical protein